MIVMVMMMLIRPSFVLRRVLFTFIIVRDFGLTTSSSVNFLVVRHVEVLPHSYCRLLGVIPNMPASVLCCYTQGSCVEVRILNYSSIFAAQYNMLFTHFECGLGRHLAPRG